MTTVLRIWRNQSRSKKVILGSSILILLGALFLLGSIGLPQQVELRVDGEVQQLRTWQKTVAGVLEEAAITLKAADEVEPALAETVHHNQVIEVIRAFPVEIKVGEELLQVTTTSKSVAEVLALGEIFLGEDDLISLELNEVITPGNNFIEVTRVTHETEVKESKIPFTTEIVADNQAVEGTRRIVQAGSTGKLREEYLVTYHNGEELARELVQKEIISQQVPRIVAQGTQRKVMVASRSGHDFQYRQAISMLATAYTHTGNPTHTGIMPYEGVVAVDPKVIPLGTKLYVDGYGFAKALDVGSGVKGNKIDLFMDSKEKALKWGRKNVKVYLLE